MRIYYKVKGLGHYRPFLKWVEKSVAEGNLPFRADRNGKPFIFVDDLLIFKGQQVGPSHAKFCLGLETFLNEGVIAFGEVKKLANEILASGIDLGDYRSYVDTKLPNLGYVYLYVPETGKYLKKAGLEAWL